MKLIDEGIARLSEQAAAENWPNGKLYNAIYCMGLERGAAIVSFPATDKRANDGLRLLATDIDVWANELFNDEKRDMLRAAADALRVTSSLKAALRRAYVESWTTDRGTQHYCALCNTHSKWDGPERHAPGCLAAPEDAPNGG